MYKKTVAVDLDGVLAQYTGFKGQEHIEPPMPGAPGDEDFDAAAFLKELSQDYKIIIYTARDPFTTRSWLEQWDLSPYIEDVNFCPINGRVGKPVAVAYVDDRGVRFKGDFRQAVKDVHELAGPSVEKDTGVKALACPCGRNIFSDDHGSDHGLCEECYDKFFE